MDTGPDACAYFFLCLHMRSGVYFAAGRPDVGALAGYDRRDLAHLVHQAAEKIMLTLMHIGATFAAARSLLDEIGFDARAGAADHPMRERCRGCFLAAALCALLTRAPGACARAHRRASRPLGRRRAVGRCRSGRPAMLW